MFLSLKILPIKITVNYNVGVNGEKAIDLNSNLFKIFEKNEVLNV
jgi:hypothetical protein